MAMQYPTLSLRRVSVIPLGPDHRDYPTFGGMVVTDGPLTKYS